MKIIYQILIVAAFIVMSANHSFAVVDQKLEVQGTNLVLSFSSAGYDFFLIQYRPTLDSTTPWMTLTNNYPANSTNRTTFVIPCCLLPASPAESSGGGSSSGGDGPPTPGFAMSQESFADSDTTELWTMQESGVPVPLMLFPPGMEPKNATIFEVAKTEKQNDSTSFSEFDSFGEESSSPMNLTSGGCDCPTMAFFRVFHIPNFPASITNYTFDGPIFIPVDFKDYIDRVDNIEVLLNGAPTDYAEFTSLYYNNQTNWGMNIYFDRVASGPKQIQLRSTVRLDDDIGEETVYLVLTNLTRSITLNNQVTFTNWDDLIWNNTNYTFRAQTKTNVTDWQIDIYDAFGDFVNGASGHTTNGQIEWTWDLKDTANNTRDSLENDPFFDPYITFAVAGTGATTTRAQPLTILPYPTVGNWIVTYQNTFYEPGTTSGNNYIGGMNAIAGGPSFRDIPVLQIPVKFGTNSYTQAERNDSWLTLKGHMISRENRNLYYYGHGSGSSIGGDLHIYGTNNLDTSTKVLPGSKAILTSKIVRDEITFNKHGGARPYRFVWLDGCNTANGDWPEAFGINKGTNTYSYYTNSVTNPNHKRPSAFVGWAVKPGGPGWGTTGPGFDFRSQWMFRWHYYWNSEKLTEAFQHARQDSNWPPGGDNQLWNGLRVFGYRDLRMNEYNQKTDWPGP